jgi:hypothetical protein
MRPWLVDNRDQVLISSIRGRKLKKGDIILYRNQQDNYILHRIHRVEERGYRTMGDACTHEDDMLVRYDDILGVVEEIDRKGKTLKCSSIVSRMQFAVWGMMLPLREELLWFYYFLLRIKSKL